MKRMPPLNFVRVFECSARHLNFRRAAEELGVTPGAVSQQIRMLEISLEVPLFERLPKGLRLTTAGQQLYPVTGQVLRMLQDTVDRLPSPRQVVRVTAAPTLCTRWLVPRLSSFYERYPTIGVQIDATTPYVQLSNEPFDVAIRHARHISGSLHNEFLFADDVVAVCSPNIAMHYSDGVEDILKAKLLCWDTQDYWPSWFSAKGLTGYHSVNRISFSHLMLALDAAIAGQGVALTALKLVEHDLQQGRLVRLFGAPVATGSGYYVVARRESLASRHIAAFVDWIVDEARKVDGAAKIANQVFPNPPG